MEAMYNGTNVWWSPCRTLLIKHNWSCCLTGGMFEYPNTLQELKKKSYGQWCTGANHVFIFFWAIVVKCLLVNYCLLLPIGNNRGCLCTAGSCESLDWNAANKQDTVCGRPVGNVGMLPFRRNFIRFSLPSARCVFRNAVGSGRIFKKCAGMAR